MYSEIFAQRSVEEAVNKFETEFLKKRPAFVLQGTPVTQVSLNLKCQGYREAIVGKDRVNKYDPNYDLFCSPALVEHSHLLLGLGRYDDHPIAQRIRIHSDGKIIVVLVNEDNKFNPAKYQIFRAFGQLVDSVRSVENIEAEYQIDFTYSNAQNLKVWERRGNTNCSGSYVSPIAPFGSRIVSQSALLKAGVPAEEICKYMGAAIYLEADVNQPERPITSRSDRQH